MTNQTTVILSVHCILETGNYFANLHDGRKHFVVPMTEGEAEALAELFQVTIRNIVPPPAGERFKEMMKEDSPETPFTDQQTTQP